MPPAVPLVAAAAGSLGAGLGIGGTLFSAGLLGSIGAAVVADTVFGFVVAGAVNFVGSRALARKPKAPAFDQAALGRAVVVRSSIESHKVVYGTARVSGPLVYAATSDAGTGGAGEAVNAANVFLHLVIPLAGHEVEEITTIYLNDRAVTLDADGWVTDSPYTLSPAGAYPSYKHARVYKHLGAADQAADAALTAAVPDWTAAHRLRGIAYLYVRLQWSTEVFPQGIPNVSAVVKGKKVYDPRTGLTQWSDNAALCVRDYLTSDYGFGCASDEINDTSFTAAANVCDEAVTLSTGGTQARYTANGVIDTGVAPLDNLHALVSATAGAVTYAQGAFRLHPGAYDAPTTAITADMLAGPVKATLRTPRKDLFNAVRGTYVDPNRGWQPTDFPPVTNSTYETQDGGQRIERDVQLPFTTHPEAAQRIGKILLEKARQGIKVELTLNHTALAVSAYDTVTLTDAQMGWSAKVFRVLKATTTGAGPISLALQEESSASYDWNSGEATVYDPAPDTNLPDPFTVLPPGSPAVTETLYAPLDGSAVRSNATVSWAASPDAFVREYQVERKLAAETEYTVVGRTTATTLEAADVAQGTHTFRVKAVNTLGVSSPYASSAVEIAGLTAPPAALTNFTLNAISNNAHLGWDQSPDLDVRIGGKIRVRYTPEIASPAWSSAVDVGPALPGVATQAVVPLLNGTYLAKAVDSSGNESVTAAAIKSTVADVVKMNRVATSTQHPAFGGFIQTGAGIPLMAVVDDALQLNSYTLFDSVAGDFDDAPGYFDAGVGGFSSAGYYYFTTPGTAAIDVGKVTTSRVTAAITAEVYDASNTFDQAAGDFDDRAGLFDGDDVTGLDVWLSVSTSDDGATWTAFRRFFVGDYTCRYYQFLLAVSVTGGIITTPSLNVRVSALSVTADMPDVTDSGTLTTSAAGVTAVTFARTFVIAPDVGVTVQNAATGDFPVVQNVTATGFDLGVKNSGGSFIARTTSWVSNGY